MTKARSCYIILKPPSRSKFEKKNWWLGVRITVPAQIKGAPYVQKLSFGLSDYHTKNS